MLRKCVLITVILLFVPTSIFASDPDRPFWTEKSTFIEGDVIYAVGVASDIKSIEEGREIAFNNAKTEIMNYAQIADLKGAGIALETQMTFEEKEGKKSFNIFRLIKTDLKKLLAIKNKMATGTSEKLEELNKSIEMNKSLTESFVVKRLELDKIKQELSSLSASGGSILMELTNAKNEALQRQAELERIYAAFLEKIKGRDEMIYKFQKQKQIYDSQESKLDALFNEIMLRVNKMTNKAIKYVKKGMTAKDVLSLLGSPNMVYQCDEYRYGSARIKFDRQGCMHGNNDDNGIVRSVFSK